MAKQVGPSRCRKNYQQSSAFIFMQHLVLAAEINKEVAEIFIRFFLSFSVLPEEVS